MFDAATLKLLAAMLLFVIPVHLCGDVLPKREIAGRRLTRAQAQIAGAAIGLVLGVGFLLAME
jgi:hypothetical protein